MKVNETNQVVTAVARANELNCWVKSGSGFQPPPPFFLMKKGIEMGHVEESTH